MQTSQKQQFKHGFTLLEVLIVVLIAVLVTMAAVPMYKRSQDRNRYMAASAVLVEMAEALRLMKEERPAVTIHSNSTGSKFRSNSIVSDDSDPGDLAIQASNMNDLQRLKYMGMVPFDANGQYMGYTFEYDSRTTYLPNCGTGCPPSTESKAEIVACMKGTSSITGLTCAWVDKYGNVNHN